VDAPRTHTVRKGNAKTQQQLLSVERTPMGNSNKALPQPQREPALTLASSLPATPSRGNALLSLLVLSLLSPKGAKK
jgi:hypothetical protein